MSIDGRGRSVREPPGVLLELHEHEIPDLDEAVALGVGRARRPAGNLVAVVVEDFRARAAGAGVAHLPEVVGAGDADDPRIGQARDLLPQVEGLVVVDVDRRRQLVLRQPEFLGDQVPGKLDGAVLEIVAEREVAEHLEEGVVAGGVADIVEVVVLAAGAHAFLRADRALVGALLEAGEDVLELHHAGVGEHQGRIVARHERRRRHDLVPGLGEVVQKARPDVVDAAHEACRSLVPDPAPRRAKSRAALVFSGGICSGGGKGCPGRGAKVSRASRHAEAS